MFKMNIAPLAAAAILVAAPSAHAVATGTATLSNVHFQLFDLDPTDGVAPAVTFANDGAQVSSYASDGVTADNDFDSGAVGAVLSVSSLMGANSSFAMTTAGNPVGAGVGPGATGGATAAGAGSQASGWGYALASSFTVTPHTLLVLTAATSGFSATATQPGEYVYATGSVQLWDGNNSQNSHGSAYASVQADGNSYSSLPPTITASFSNLAGVTATGYAYAYAGVSAQGVAAIPEPESYAMLLAGLLVIGALARRTLPR